MAFLIAGLAGAAISAGASIYGANKASKDRQAALQSANDQNKAKADELKSAQDGLQQLLDSQPDPAQVYRDIFTSMPDMLGQVLPPLSWMARTTSVDFTKQNVANYNLAINKMFPDYKREEKNLIGSIDSLDPNKLGADEIAAITRKISPLIPEGSLGPNGAVQGGTTNPVSLYRNAISSAYDTRRQEYMSAVGSFTSNAENSAYRQEEKASSFLSTFLNLAGNAAGQVTQQTVAQNSANVANQFKLLDTVLAMPQAQFNSAPYDAAIAGNINNIGNAVGSIGNVLYRNQNGSNLGNVYNGTGFSYNQAIQGGGQSIGAIPNFKAALG